MNRTDGLPNPETVGEIYLAEILDELRGLRRDLSSPPAPESAPNIERVKDAKQEPAPNRANRR